jgi:hypothetical protein
MTVRATNIFEVAPENVEAFTALIPEARTTYEKLGATNLQVFQMTVAGPNTGVIVGSVDFDSMASFGAFVDASAGDADFLALQGKAFALGTLNASVVGTELG